MRLIDCLTLQLVEYFDVDLPPYAILSHRWETEEVTLQDIQTKLAIQKAGYAKLVQCCRQAWTDGYRFAWIDTCCIDKSSSSELSEAINSMYRWYQNAAVCYAYLSDVEIRNGSMYRFTESKWFTRGWTLQELIAPSVVLFFSKDWIYMGNKQNLAQSIGAVTGIDETALSGRNLQNFSIAQRMSWASKRTTTRKEDTAYCLMGIFGINMPLLYGEGERAFIRLQEEIMKDSDDQSLLAWENTCFEDDSLVVHGYNAAMRGPLAHSPIEFANAGRIVPYRDWHSSTPYTMTNNGLRIELPIHIVRGSQITGLCLAVLGCHYEDDLTGPLGIFIRPLMRSHKLRMNDGLDGDQYARDHGNKRPVIVDHTQYFRHVQKVIYLRKEVLLPASNDLDRRYGLLIRLHQRYTGFRVAYTYPDQRTIELKDSYAIIRSPSCKGAVLFINDDGAQFWVLMRIDMPVPAQENDRWERSRLTCKIVLCSPHEHHVKVSHGLRCLDGGTYFLKAFELLAQCGSNKTFEDFADQWRIIAETKKEVIIGERMLITDVGVVPRGLGLYELE